jgi:acyl-coenzyme A thioesterase PaaI-like protein
MLLDYWKKFSKYPGGKLIFGWLLGFYIPYSGSITAEILELEKGYSKVLMRDRRRLRNHLHSVHAAALMNFAELTSGLAFISGLGKNMQGIVTHFEMNYLKKGRGDLIAEAKSDFVDEAGEKQCQIEAIIRDSKQDIVARGRATWSIRPAKS